MHAFSAEHRRSLLTGNTIVRVLIVSYFIALALGVIDGTDIAALAAPFMPATAASILTSSCVLVLSTMILLGWQRRPAALILALMMFWASYLAMMAAPNQHLGSFWRDLALIGALVMTYADGTRRKRGTPAADRDATATGGRPISRLSQAMATTRSVISRPTSRGASARGGEQAELYRKDLDIARAS